MLFCCCSLSDRSYCITLSNPPPVLCMQFYCCWLAKLLWCYYQFCWCDCCCVLLNSHHNNTSRRGLAIGSTGTFPGGLVADSAHCPVFLLYLNCISFFCLPNVPKWSFPTVAFPNKSIINHKLVSLDWQRRDSHLFQLPPSNGFEQSRCARLKEGEILARRNS